MERGGVYKTQETVKKFLSKTLEPLNPDNLVKKCPDLSQEEAKEITKSALNYIYQNILADTDDMLLKQGYIAKLNKLDILKAQKGYAINMNPFKFTHQDPVEIRNRIFALRYQEYLEELQQINDDFSQRIENVKQRIEQNREELNKNKEKIAEVISQVNQV